MEKIMKLESGVKYIYAIIIQRLMGRTMFTQDVIHNPLEVIWTFSLSDIEYH